MHKLIGEVRNVEDLEDGERAYPEFGMIYWVHPMEQPRYHALATVDYIERRGDTLFAVGSKQPDYQDTASEPISGDNGLIIASQLRLNKRKRKKS